MRIKPGRLVLLALAAGVVGYLLARPRRRPASSAAFCGNELTRVFHESSCRYAGSDHCTAAFATRHDAVAAGYEPCQVCMP